MAAKPSPFGAIWTNAMLAAVLTSVRPSAKQAPSAVSTAWLPCSASEQMALKAAWRTSMMASSRHGLTLARTSSSFFWAATARASIDVHRAAWSWPSRRSSITPTTRRSPRTATFASAARAARRTPASLSSRPALTARMERSQPCTAAEPRSSNAFLRTCASASSRLAKSAASSLCLAAASALFFCSVCLSISLAICSRRKSDEWPMSICGFTVSTLVLPGATLTTL
mmetsp:Transcript_77514/g.227309  ORF Transcript_77514/g.227309 Transcript_77514/m.227309 type:complete len:227 (+) Transcript_77514:876-1556(+)